MPGLGEKSLCGLILSLHTSFGNGSGTLSVVRPDRIFLMAWPGSAEQRRKERSFYSPSQAGKMPWTSNFHSPLCSLWIVERQLDGFLTIFWKLFPSPPSLFVFNQKFCSLLFSISSPWKSLLYWSCWFPRGGKWNSINAIDSLCVSAVHPYTSLINFGKVMIRQIGMIALGKGEMHFALLLGFSLCSLNAQLVNFTRHE